MRIVLADDLTSNKMRNAGVARGEKERQRICIYVGCESECQEELHKSVLRCGGEEHLCECGEVIAIKGLEQSLQQLTVAHYLKGR